ncbi:MAG: hypothetical protein NTY02_07675 [Acidobacteria bacterium]|nr:hypothetical protein [Acidobacteriota bacterium]
MTSHASRAVLIVAAAWLAGLQATLPAVPVDPSPAAAWNRDAVCGPPHMREFGPPRKTERTSCAPAYCVDLGAGERVCSCRTIGPGDDVSVEVLFERPPAEPIRMASDLWEMAGSDAFRVFRSDLTGDGQAETIVATLVNRGNGMGVESWRVSVIDGRHPATPASWEAQDFGVLSIFTRPASGGPCRLLAGEWIPGHDPARGEGLYFVGRWLRFLSPGPDGPGTSGSRFEPETERPVIRRRLLVDFERERLSAMDADPNRPVAWFASPAVESVGHLCHAAEDLVFGFRTVTGLLASVCRARSDEYLVYRSQAPRGVVEQFPARLEGSWGQFELSSYFRGGGVQNAGLDLTGLRFNGPHGDVEVFQDWSAASNKWLVGLTLTDRGTGKPVTLDADPSTQLGALSRLRGAPRLARVSGRAPNGAL